MDESTIANKQQMMFAWIADDDDDDDVYVTSDSITCLKASAQCDESHPKAASVSLAMSSAWTAACHFSFLFVLILITRDMMSIAVTISS